MIFSFKVYKGKVCTLNIGDGKLNYLSIVYSLSNICTKNYWNRASTVKIIVGGWVVYFFLRHSVMFVHCCVSITNHAVISP